MNKTKYMLVIVAVFAVAGAFAKPHHRGFNRGFGHGPHPVRHHHSHSTWGRGGRNFWPGFVGGVVGGIVSRRVVAPAPTVVVSTPTVVTTPTIVTPTVVAPTVVAPTVVTTPVTTTQQVWVEGCYINQLQPNGTYIKVWQPGHYETRTITVQ